MNLEEALKHLSLKKVSSSSGPTLDVGSNQGSCTASGWFTEVSRLLVLLNISHCGFVCLPMIRFTVNTCLTRISCR